MHSFFITGAVRQHLRSVLRKQLSQKRAEERRQAEEERKFYNEEEEEILGEEEMTDGETTGKMIILASSPTRLYLLRPLRKYKETWVYFLFELQYEV